MNDKKNIISFFKEEVVKGSGNLDIPIPFRKKLLFDIVIFQLPLFWFVSKESSK